MNPHELAPLPVKVWVWDWGFEIGGLGFGVWDWGFGIGGLGLGVHGFEIVLNLARVTKV